MSLSLDDLRGRDHLVRAMGIGSKVRAIAVSTALVGQTLLERHGAAPTAAMALTRAATACLLMGGTIKGREQISIQFNGDGPLGELLAIADAHGNVRATVERPLAHAVTFPDGLISVSGGIGAGNLTISKGLGQKEPYRGIVPIITGEIGQDLAHYYTASEQKPTAMGIGEHMEKLGIVAAGGFLLQRFPGVDISDEELADIEKRIADLPPIPKLFLEGATPYDLLKMLLPDMQPLEHYPVQFQCTCSKERYNRLLLTLGADELSSMIEEQGEAELRCHFCNTAYLFEEVELKGLLSEARHGVN